MADEQSIGNGENTSPITRWLANLPSGMLVVYGGLMAFGTYFCMYAFRKPFQAVTYEAFGQQFNIDMKIVFVLSQLFGYLISKYIGIKVCSEIGKKWRLPLMIGLILFAEVSLVLFGLVPLKWKLIPIFMNGLPLGMVWGLCVLYIEGRKITEFLLAGMACSYIIASGVTKDVGKMVLKQLEEVDITVFWMPAVTGLLFLPLFLLFSWLLSKMPPPTPADEEERTHRQPMKGPEKTAFIKFFWFGILIQVVFYFFLTAFRDVRDGYSAEIFEGLGIADQSSIFTRSERWVAFAALAMLIIIRFFNSKKWGAIPNLAFQLIAPVTAFYGPRLRTSKHPAVGVEQGIDILYGTFGRSGDKDVDLLVEILFEDIVQVELNGIVGYTYGGYEVGVCQEI